MNVIICYLSMVVMQFSATSLSTEDNLYKRAQSTEFKNQVQTNNDSTIIKTSKSNLPCPFKTRSINKELSCKKELIIV